MADSICSAVNSVLSQKTDIKYELIVVNDGSTDDTESLLEEYSSRENVTVVNQSNLGFSGARNKGIDIAQGNYLMFVDADDKLLPGAIENLMNCALRNDADVVEGAFLNKLPDGSLKPDKPHLDGRINPKENMQGFFWGKVYRHECFLNLRIPDGYWFEDSLNAQIMWEICNRAFTIKEYVYEYLRNDKGITASSKNRNKSVDSLYITRQLLLDRKSRGWEFTQDEYEYFIRMVELTYYRTRQLPENIRKSIFIKQCELYDMYYKGYNTLENNYKKRLEKALKKKNYRSYLLNCEIRI